MEKETEKTLQLLNEIEKDRTISQRTLSAKMGIALGLTNTYIKRCVKKGYVKISTIPKNRIKYLITPKGITEKTRLTCEYLQYSIQFYKETRKRIKDSFLLLEKIGVKNIIFYGAGEVAEISYISLQGTTLNLAGVVDDFKHGVKFLGLPVMKRDRLKKVLYDKIIITSFLSAEIIYSSLLNDGIETERIFLLSNS